ncbi:hypothetical protein ACWD6R_32170 [Streptomyces sp. NPDC005151]
MFHVRELGAQAVGAGVVGAGLHLREALGRDLLELATDVAAVEQTRRGFEAAAAQMAAKLQDSIRERAVAHGPRPQPTAATSTPPHTQRPGAQPAPGRSTPTGGAA